MKAELIMFVDRPGGGFIMNLEADGKRHSFEITLDSLQFMIEQGVQAMARAARSREATQPEQPPPTPPPL